MQVLKYVLTCYAWVVTGLLLFFLGRIAYFYEQTSGERIGYRFLLLPALLLMGGMVWYFVADIEFTGQPVGDLLLFGGGISLGLFGMRLQEFMTGERR